MGRKIIDYWPTISLTVGTEAPKFSSHLMSEAEAWAAREEFFDLINTALRRMTRRQFDISAVIEHDARCEHCNHSWTAASPDYNGGCCAKDSANDPERLADLRTLAEEVLNGDYYRLDDENGRYSGQPVSWPGSLAQAALKWLDEGRDPSGATTLSPLIKRVRDGDWCTVWSDPGDYPSNAGAGPLPDQVTLDHAPGDLATDLASLLDDLEAAQADRKVG